jgi:hypothetical protein
MLETPGGFLGKVEGPFRLSGLADGTEDKLRSGRPREVLGVAAGYLGVHLFVHCGEDLPVHGSSIAPVWTLRNAADLVI